MTADIKQNRMDLEYNTPETIYQGNINNRRCMHKTYDETQLLNLETDASGIRLRAALLETRSSTSYQRDKAPDNSIFRSITFASKSMSSAERRYSNIEREVLGILHRLQKSHHYCFVREEYNNRSQTTSCKLQERCSNAISENTINSQNTPVQSKNHIQTQTRSIHSRMAVKTKPQGNQR